MRVYELTAATMAATVHHGSYNTIGDAHEAVLTWIDANRYRAPAILERMIGEGRLGLKTGSGFYDYQGRDVTAYRSDVLLRTLGMLKHAGLWQPPAETTRS